MPNVGLRVGLGMAALNKLTAVRIRTAPSGRHGDGGGLYLDKTADGGKWLYRYTFSGKRRDMGLGSMSAVTLAQARQQRDRWAAVLASGRDPIAERAREREANATRDDPSLADLVDTVFGALKHTLKGQGEAGRWMSPLRVHVLPALGRRPVSSLRTADFVRVLQPIWRSKPSTAEKAFSRLRLCYRKGKRLGHPIDPDTLDAARELMGDLHISPEHIAATRWQDAPALFQRLSGDTSGLMCLRLLLLTAVRGDAARGAHFSEISGAVWTVPKERVKGQLKAASDFRVPLSTQAVAIIDEARRLSNDPEGGLLFPGDRGTAISQNALLKAIDKIGEPGRPHGFRTTFRTWVQDTLDGSHDLAAETALGHVIGSKVRRAYARSDMLDQRAVLMQRWADYVTGEAA
ncbi:site-specific integrase [Sinirhodobacter huangdaonensis]|uniref:Site-specific integrase n=2 Tax=Paenirhodobacter huangdaonensis TaxID=2501515 RepID=A0A443M097_9RHOB|nr:site-specific integrase [Sinirhodobacter huangdaonensis]